MNIKKIISAETPFQVLDSSIAVGPSAEGYTLNYSADGVNYDAWPDATPANETLIINNAPEGLYLKLVGNQSDVTVQL